MPDFYSVAEAAEVLNVNPQTVRRLIRERRLTASSWGASYLIREGDLQTFAASYSGRRGPKPKAAPNA